MADHGPTSWRDVWILYVRELRSALRERSIVINSIVLPIFLYPLLLWLGFSGISFVRGLSEGFSSRVVLHGLPPAHAPIRDTLAARGDVELREGGASADSSVARMRRGALDAVAVFFPPDEAGAGLAGNFRVRIHYDRAEERSRRARNRLEDVIEGYRSRWIEGEAESLGVSPSELRGFRITSRNVATRQEMGAFFLGEMIPLFLVIMVALGCFYPAIDATAGERERSTWETLMSVSASRGSIVTAKYLYVATLGTVAGVLNVGAMLASVGTVLAPLLREESGSFGVTIPAVGIPVMLVGAVALALFFAAAMMLMASFARTFKDGQSMVTPIYFLAMTPLFLMQAPDLHLTPALAAIPIINVAVMVRDAITGTYSWLLMAETVVVGLAAVAVTLRVSRWVLQFEDFLLGSYDGSFWKFAKERMGGDG